MWATRTGYWGTLWNWMQASRNSKQRNSHKFKLFVLRYPRQSFLLAPIVAAHSTLLLQERVSGWAARVVGSGVRNVGERWRMSTAWVSTSPATTMTSAPLPRPFVPCAVRCTATSTASGPTCTSRQRSTILSTHRSVRCSVQSSWWLREAWNWQFYLKYRIAMWMCEWQFHSLSVCVAQHKDQLFLLGQKKRGRRTGSASVTVSPNNDIFPVSARQQSHYFNAHDNEDRLSNPQDSKNMPILDFSRSRLQWRRLPTANYITTPAHLLVSPFIISSDIPVSCDPVTDLVTSGLMQFLGQNSANSAAANAIMMQRLLGSG